MITASTDTDARKLKHEARKFRVIRSAWILVPTISYATALLVCFICNLAVNHTLSWFFIVLAALLCAYTFVPTVTSFIQTNKLLVFSVTTYLSVSLLLFTCAVYTNGLSWFLTACIGVLMGYVLLFLPILLSKTSLTRYKFIISFTIACVLTILLLLNVNFWHPFMLVPSILITFYGYAPAIFCTVICALHFDAFLKAGICVVSSTVAYYFVDYVVDVLFGTNENSYQVNFSDWEQCLEGNIHVICLASFLVIGVVFLAIGMFRVFKNQKTDL